MSKPDMHVKSLFARAISKYRRTVPKYVYRRMINLHVTCPVVSFSFDDAPRTAFAHGGEILRSYGAAATFYVSLGILESESPSGPIASLGDLEEALKKGHELGCHTFDHRNSWKTRTEVFVQSVLRNRQVLSELMPESRFSSLAYPVCAPRPAIKRRVGDLFSCCRGGGQAFNVGNTDLNLLKAFFLDARNGDSIETVRKLIDENAKARGWLIFATHDIDDNPSRYGCSKIFFEKVVKHATESGALLLPVGKSCQHIQS